jgi:hypothetical protein
MRTTRLLAVSLIFFGILGSSCGSRPHPQDGSGAKEISRKQMIEDLSPHWAWMDPEMRRLSHPVDWSAEPTPEGISYPRVFQLLSTEERIARPKGENLFYVLKDGRDSTQVTRVEYEMTRRDLFGRSTALTGRREAIYQESDRRYLIPILSELGSRDQLTEVDLYCVRIRVHYLEGVQEIRVEFRVSGPLPDLIRKQIRALDDGQGEQGIAQLRSAAAEIVSEQWQNPSSRRMRLKFVFSPNLRLSALLERTDFSTDVWAPPTQRSWIEMSQLSVVLNFLRVQSSLYGERVISLEGLSEIVLPVAPKEELVLTWGVTPHSVSDRCELPAREVHSVTWNETRYRNGGRGGGGPLEVTITKSGSAIRETRILGWNVIRPYVASFRMRFLEAASSKDEFQIGNQDSESAGVLGLYPGTVFSPFACQGLIE